jgi:hypothetical protein
MVAQVQVTVGKLECNFMGVVIYILVYKEGRKSIEAVMASQVSWNVRTACIPHEMSST